MLFLFTKYRSLTLLSFESFHIGLGPVYMEAGLAR
jgi:hypothetical protein